MPEATLRLVAFAAVLALMLALERWRPWAQPRPLGRRRWPHHAGLAALSALALKFTLPIAAIGTAIWAETQGIGLLPWLDTPPWLAIPTAFLALDLLIYWQHRATHQVPILWRLHRVHHADPELDTSSALRFHPLEIVGSMLLKMAAVTALGAPPVAVLTFEIALNAGALFTHAAIALPPRLTRAMGWVLVTPDMHRIHHSERQAETDSCYGTILPWWDWWFRTHRGFPEGPLILGLPHWREPQEQPLHRLLAQPFTTTPRPAGANGDEAATGLPKQQPTVPPRRR